MSDVLYSVVVAHLAEHFQVDRASLTPDTRLVEDLYADSLELLDLVLLLNDRFEVEIDPASLEQMTSVAQVVSVLRRLSAPGGSVA